MKKVCFFIGMVFMVFGSFAKPLPPSLMAKSRSVFTPEQQTAIEMIVHQYLIKNPKVLAEASQALQRQQMDEQSQKMVDAARANADKFLRHPHSPVAGNKNGDITVVAFLDYNCPYCRHMTKSLVEMITDDDNLRVVFKEFPIHGDDAMFAAKAALAASLQGKYLQMHKAMMSSDKMMTKRKVLSIAKRLKLNMRKLKVDMNAPWIEAEIENNGKLAELLEVPGTPAFIIAKTQMKEGGKGDIESSAGMLPKRALEHLVDQVRAS